MSRLPKHLLAAVMIAVAVREASAGPSAWMAAAREGEVPEIPASAAIPADARPADRIVRTLLGMGRDCAIEVAGDFLDDRMRAARIAPIEVMPDGRRVSDDALGRRCSRGQEPAWAVSAGEDAEDLPLNFGWRREPVGVVNRADLTAALGRDFQAAEVVREGGGRYRVSRLVRSDGVVLPASSGFRLRLTDEERERFQKVAMHIHHKVPGRKLEFPEPTGYERVTKHYGFQIEGDARPDGTFELKAFVLTYFVARPEGLHDLMRMEIAPDGAILSADDPRLAGVDPSRGRRPPSQQGPQTHALVNELIDYWNRDWPAFAQPTWYR